MLVAGGGVAGVFAALRAASKDVQVFLIDRAKAPLALQRENTKRIVSPTFYDWPSFHWRDKSYQGIPLDYPETSPAQLAEGWANEVVTQANKSGSTLHWCPGIQYRESSADGWCPPWYAELRDCETGQQVSEGLKGPYDIVLLCFGVGGETERGLPRSEKGPAFPFFRFWKDDPLPDGARKFGAHRAEPQAHGEWAEFVIVGAGDGGLQDFMRLVTGGVPVRQLLEEVFRAVAPDPQIFQTLYRVFDQEEQFARHYTYWHTSNSPKLLDHWQRACADAVEEFYQGEGRRRENIKTVLKQFVRFDDVLVYHEFSNFGRCYGANRFLALLLEQYLAEVGRHGSPFRFGRKGLFVECGPGHASSATDPGHHFGGTHFVHFDCGGICEVVSCRNVITRMGPSFPDPVQEESPDDSVGKKFPIPTRKETLPSWLPDWGPPSRRSPTPARSSGRIAPSLYGDRAWRALLWRSLVGTAVLKDRDGRVFAWNPRFASLVDKPASEIMAKLPSEYLGPEIGGMVERHDQRVRSEPTTLLSFERIQRSGLTIDHYSFRFPFIMGDSGGPGNASLGFDMLGRRVVLQGESNAVQNQPSLAELERFFEWMPCSMAVHDRSHRYFYANQAFRRVLAPRGSPALSTDLIYGKMWGEVLNSVGAPPAVEDPGDEQKNLIWQKQAATTPWVHNWWSQPPFGRKQRLVVGFGLRDAEHRMIALASVGFRWEDIENLKDPPQANPYEIEP